MTPQEILAAMRELGEVEICSDCNHSPTAVHVPQEIEDLLWEEWRRERSLALLRKEPVG
jgi:hypothetical protein